MSKTVQIENHLDVEQVAGFLRALADELEDRCDSCLQEYGIDLHDFNRIKLGLEKGETGELFLKIKVKEREFRRQPSKKKQGRRSGDDLGGQEYKILKKRLKAGFTALGKALKSEELPESPLFRSFLEDSRQMTAWPGFGDAYYRDYEELCGRFELAWKAKDRQQLQRMYAELTSCMKSCHERYK
jgi:XXXCH domain-containing protein